MKLSIIGFGHMGSAIIAGAVKAGIVSEKEVFVADKSQDALKRAVSLGVNTVSAEEAASGADIIIIAVRPRDLEELAGSISVPESAVAVSICAGKRLETLGRLFGKARKIVRVMPNTPALVGEGMSAICGNENVSENELERVLGIFRSFGKAEILPECLFDTVTAVSGSGPAYVYAFIIALKKYAESCGMAPDKAEEFAAQTVLGSAKMVLGGSEPPEVLKKNICTPGGTTVEAVKVLDDRGFEQTVIDAAKACENRSRELGKN